jgi:hypothetical protein
MKIRLLLAALLGMSPAVLMGEKTPPPPAPVDELVLRPDLWSSGPAALQEAMKPLGFEWTSAAQEVARSVRPGLTLAGAPLNEILIRFRDGKAAGVTVIYYNRGDAGELSEKNFEKLLEDLRASLATLIGKPPIERGKDASSAVRAEGLVWDADAARYVLEWSATKESRTKMIPFRAEFVRLSVTPPGEEERPVGAAATTGSSRQAVKKFVGRDQVVRVPGGEVKLKNVPMVDQGQKGYCVVATVERVMRYYGAEVDQHELAQIANSDASKGTSVDAMLGSLKKLTARLGVKIKAIYDWDIADFLKMVEDYNRATKRGKVAPEIQLGNQIIDVDEVFMQIKPEIYKEVRLKKASDFGKFQREIQRSIDEGIPLLWSVRLGLVKEKEIPQAFGGHMRLITGYNPTTREILYSDSWGMGHEEKRMAMDDAWTITSGLNSLQPLGG